MKLIELDPRWLIQDGQRVGFIFRCPLDPRNDRRWQSCFFAPTPRLVQWALFDTIEDKTPRMLIQGCRENVGWQCTPDPQIATFADMTIKPSIDGSAGGNWHGFITNGEMK